MVDCGCGSVGFDLDRLGFSGSLVGFDDLAADWVIQQSVDGDEELIEHGGRVGQSCCDCDCVVVVEDR